MGKMFAKVGRRARIAWTSFACSGLLALLAPTSLAQIQTVVSPVFSSVDSLGVDVTTGQFRLSTSEVVIGQPGAGGLAFGRHWIGSGWRDNLAGTISSSGAIYTVSVGASSETFSLSGGVYTSQQAMGSTLTFSSGTNKYTYTTRDGAVIVFNKSIATQGSVTNFWSSNEGAIETITRPSGEVVTYTYVSATSGGVTAWRPQSITNTLGYQIHFAYAIGSPNNASEVTGGFLQRTKVTGYNRAFFFCANNAHSCADSTGANWPYVTYGTEAGGIETVTNRMSQTTRYVFSGGVLTSARMPSSSTTDRLTVQYGYGSVTSVSTSVAGYRSAIYQFGADASTRFVEVTPDVGAAYSRVTDIVNGWLTEAWEDTTGTRKTVLTRDVYGRITRTTRADGDYTNLTYDPRGNITQVVEAPKTGSGLANITTSAVYPASCTNAKTCNQPTSVTDARGFRTDFVYSTTHGGVTSITSPAPTGAAPVGSGNRPQTRFTYASLSAWYKNSGGSLVAGSALHRLTETSTCSTGVSPGCVGTASETRSIVNYQAGSSSVPSNLLPALTTSRSGNTSGSGAVSMAIASTYTPLGDVATVDGPLSGSADTSYRYYDDARRLRASVGPDPDGGGSLQHRVAKVDYSVDGQPTVQQTGSVSSPSNWATLTVLQQKNLTYGSAGLLSKIEQASLSGSPAHSVIQFEYLGTEVACATMRMNPATFVSLPASACNTATAGSFGPDRMTRPNPNSFFDLSNIQQAYGTPEQRTAATMTYTAARDLETITDAKNNRTTYEQDGFGRLTKTRYPHPTTGGTSSTTDYELLTYDAVGGLTSRRLRDGTFVYSCYDNLGRLAKYSVTPSDTACATPKVTYTYDNFGRTTQVAQTGHTLTYVYDALGRLVSETQPAGTVAYEYDVAGRRTKLTWPGANALFTTYTYNTAGDLTSIKENGGTALVTFGYDNAGRRTMLTRSNGGVTSYAYNTASRLTDLATNPANAIFSDYVTLGYNPAGEIVTRTRTNTNYAYVPPTSYTDAYASNGLNQYTSARGATPTYTDNRGNMTYDGAKTYTYDFANRLTSASGSPTANLTYDPLGRLYQVSASPTVVRFVYDGVNVIGEVDGSGAVLRRYVRGPGIDEPLVWYEGAGHSAFGTPDRHHLYADERGSIVAVEGTTVTLNKYDPYGVPATGNISRFQYTGQMWIPEIGLYHYKARAYSPLLGRFMQTDPLGYADGMNAYAYARNNSINMRDPSGLLSDLSDPLAQSKGCPFSYTCGDSDYARWINGPLGGAFMYAFSEPTADPIGDIIDQVVRGGEQVVGWLWDASDEIAGSIWSAPNTVIGLALGSAGHVLGWLFNTSPSFNADHGHIEFVNNPLMWAGAMALGDVVIYGPSLGPNQTGLSQASIRMEERQHVMQSRILGVLYFPLHLMFGSASFVSGTGWHGPANLLEAGPHAAGQAPRPWWFQ